MFGASFVRGLSEGEHAAILEEIQFFSSDSLDSKAIRNIVVRFVYSVDNNRVNELFNLPVIQDDNGAYMIGYPAKLLDRVSHLIGASVPSSNLTFDINKSYKSIGDLLQLPELSELREEGFKPIKGNFYVSGKRIIGLSCLITLGKNSAGYINVINSSVLLP